MKKSVWVIISLGLIFGLNPTSFADHHDKGEHCKMHTKKSFEEADKDRDGTLDREEAKVVCKEDFDLMDKDRDGTLSKEELNACKGEKGKSGHKKAAKPA
jgi:Ca2+-binding EF-hand superfamily protein